MKLCDGKLIIVRYNHASQTQVLDKDQGGAGPSLSKEVQLPNLFIDLDTKQSSYTDPQQPLHKVITYSNHRVHIKSLKNSTQMQHGLGAFKIKYFEWYHISVCGVGSVSVYYSSIPMIAQSPLVIHWSPRLPIIAISDVYSLHLTSNINQLTSMATSLWLMCSMRTGLDAFKCNQKNEPYLYAGTHHCPDQLMYYRQLFALRLD